MIVILNYINIFFLFYMFLYAVINFLITFFATLRLDSFFSKKAYYQKNILTDEKNYVPISIIVPAYNEELTVVDSIKSLLDLDYPEFEICVVNDGSKDETSLRVIEAFNLKKIEKNIEVKIRDTKPISLYENQDKIRIILINKVNGGKASALNSGINYSSYPLFISMDADSLLQKDSLKKIVRPFLENSETIAVGGNIKISNNTIIKDEMVIKYQIPKKWLVRFQLVEYIRVFLTYRVAFNIMNGNLIVSGAFGVYKKNEVIKVGGYSTDTIGEDMDLIVKLHAYFKKNKKKYFIAYVPDAICWTQVPEKIKHLKAQRRRWHTGMGQTIKSHSFMFLNRDYGIIGLLSYPYFLLFEYITPILDLVGIISITLSFWLKIINVEFFLTYMFVYIVFNIFISFIAILLEKKTFPHLISNKIAARFVLYSIIENFGYRQMCSYFRITSFFGKKRKTWGTTVRQENANEDAV